MKIRKEDLETTERTAMELFYQGIKSPVTSNKYTRTLQRILCDYLEDVLEGSLEQRASELVIRAKENPQWVTSVLLVISRKLKERTALSHSDPDYLNPQSFDNYFKPLKKLLDMNDVPVVWKKIYSTYPEQDNNQKSRGYTKEEIQKMLRFANGSMERAIVLVAASSGIRLGGLDLTWGDVRPIYNINDKLTFDITESEQELAQVVCAVVTVYKGTAEEYPAFITPEAYGALDDYRMEWIRDVGREPKPKEPLFKQDGDLPRKLNPNGIKSRVYDLLLRSNLRKPLAKGVRKHDVPIMHGFRKFFNKTNKDAPTQDTIGAIIKKELMMSHSTSLIKLDNNYYSTFIFELTREYLKAVPELTISEEERAKAEVRRLRKEKSELEKKNEEILLMKEEIAKIKQWKERSESHQKRKSALLL